MTDVDILPINKKEMIVGMWTKSFTTDADGKEQIKDIYIRLKNCDYTLCVSYVGNKTLKLGDMIEVNMDNSDMA